jgi:hypothetical protein
MHFLFPLYPIFSSTLSSTLFDLSTFFQLLSANDKLFVEYIENKWNINLVTFHEPRKDACFPEISVLAHNTALCVNPEDENEISVFAGNWYKNY